MLEKVRLGAIRPKADDAAGPTGRHPGNFQQLVYAGVIDVDARFGWWCGFGLGRGLRWVRLREAWSGERDRGRTNGQNRGKERHEWSAVMHAIILRLHGRSRKLCSASMLL